MGMTPTTPQRCGHVQMPSRKLVASAALIGCLVAGVMAAPLDPSTSSGSSRAQSRDDKSSRRPEQRRGTDDLLPGERFRVRTLTFPYTEGAVFAMPREKLALAI